MAVDNFGRVVEGSLSSEQLRSLLTADVKTTKTKERTEEEKRQDKIIDLLEKITKQKIDEQLKKLNTTIEQAVNNLKKRIEGKESTFQEKMVKALDGLKGNSSQEKAAKALVSFTEAALKKGSIYVHDEGTHLLLKAIITERKDIKAIDRELNEIKKSAVRLEDIIGMVGRGGGVSTAQPTTTTKNVVQPTTTIKNVVQTQQQGGNEVQKVKQGWVEFFADVLEPIKSGLQESGKRLWDSLLGKGIYASAKTISYLVIESLDIFKNVFINIGQDIGKLGKYLGRKISYLAIESLDIFKNVFINIGQDIGKLGKYLGKKLAKLPGIEIAVDFLKFSWWAVKESVVSAGRGLLGISKYIISGIGGLFSPIVSTIKSASAVAVKELKNVASIVFSPLTGLANIVSPIFSGIGKSISRLFKGRTEKEIPTTEAPKTTEVPVTPEVIPVIPETSMKVEKVSEQGDLCACICACMKELTKEVVKGEVQEHIDALKAQIQAQKQEITTKSMWQKIKDFFNTSIGKNKPKPEQEQDLTGNRLGFGKSLFEGWDPVRGMQSLFINLGKAISSERPVEQILRTLRVGDIIGKVVDSFTTLIGKIPGAKYIPGLQKFGGIIGQTLDFFLEPFISEISHYQGLRQTSFENLGVNKGPITSSIGGAYEGVQQQKDALKDFELTQKMILATGQSVTTVQNQQLRNLRRGITDGKELNKVTSQGLATATLIGSNAEETANFFADMYQNLRLSTTQLSGIGVGLRETARLTGITGDNLLRVAKSSEKFMIAMKNAGTFTVGAANNITRFLAEAEKTGTGEGAQKIADVLKDSLLNSQDQTTSNLLTFATGGKKDLIDKLLGGTLSNDKASMKELGEGLQRAVNLITQGRKIEDIKPEKVGILSATAKSTFGFALNELQLLAENMKKASMSFTERYEELEKATPRYGQTQSQIDERKQSAEFYQLNSYIQEFSESLNKGKNIGETLEDFQRKMVGKGNFAQDLKTLRIDASKGNKEIVTQILQKQVDLVNKKLQAAGVQDKLEDVNESIIDSAVETNKLLARIYEAENRASIEMKAAQDPISRIERFLKGIDASIRALARNAFNVADPIAGVVIDDIRSQPFFKSFSEANFSEGFSGLRDYIKNFDKTADKHLEEIDKLTSYKDTEGNPIKYKDTEKNIARFAVYLIKYSVKAIDVIIDVGEILVDIFSKVKDYVNSGDFEKIKEGISSVGSGIAAFGKALDSMDAGIGSFVAAMAALALGFNPISVALTVAAVGLYKLYDATIALNKAKEEEKKLTQKTVDIIQLSTDERLKRYDELSAEGNVTELSRLLAYTKNDRNKTGEIIDQQFEKQKYEVLNSEELAREKVLNATYKGQREEIEKLEQLISRAEQRESLTNSLVDIQKRIDAGGDYTDLQKRIVKESLAPRGEKETIDQFDVRRRFGIRNETLGSIDPKILLDNPLFRDLDQFLFKGDFVNALKVISENELDPKALKALLDTHETDKESIKILADKATKPGSIYTHDMHLEEILTTISDDLEKGFEDLFVSPVFASPVVKGFMKPQDIEDDIRQKRLLGGDETQVVDINNESLDNIDDNTSEMITWLKKVDANLEAIKKVFTTAKKKGTNNNDIQDEMEFMPTLDTSWNYRFTDTAGFQLGIE